MNVPQSAYLGTEVLEDEALRQRIGKGNVATYISLFSGCGGLDLGFSAAGIETRAMVEFDHAACNTLRGNWTWEGLKDRTNEDGSLRWKTREELVVQSRKFKEADNDTEDFQEEISRGAESWYHEIEPAILERDIMDVSTEELLAAANLKVGECSIISGGFPCQGFSQAGKQEVNDPRNFLYREFVRIVNEAKPAMFLGENVPGLLSMLKGDVIQRICEDFAACGYDIQWDILNAADYGVPQNRKRIILIGKRIDVAEFTEDGRTQLHLGCGKGEITHPEVFYKRLKTWKKSFDEIKKNVAEQRRKENE